MDTTNEPAEIDLLDVLKQRIEVDQPIYINGATTPAIEAIDGLAKATGKPVKVVQINAQSDTSQLRNTSPDAVDAVFQNTNVKVAFKE